MRHDDVLIQFPELPIATIEEAAKRLMDSVEALWSAGRLRGLLSADVGKRALEGFLAGVAETMTQVYEAGLEGKIATAVTVHLARESAQDVVALASTMAKLAEDDATMRSAGGLPLPPRSRVFIAEQIRFAKTVTDAIAR